MNDHGILNFVQSTEHIATAGQPTEAQLEALAEEGCEAVINLAMPFSDDALANEGSIVTFAEMAYFHIPVPFEAPQLSHLRLFLKLMEGLEGYRVLVHCAKNYRVSAFMYHYLRIAHGCLPAEARSPIFDQWQPDPVWQAFIDIPQQRVTRPEI